MLGHESILTAKFILILIMNIYGMLAQDIIPLEILESITGSPEVPVKGSKKAIRIIL
jgi:hypothetical protein